MKNNLYNLLVTLTIVAVSTGCNGSGTTSTGSTTTSTTKLTTTSTTDLFTLYNNSPMYLNAKDSPGCPDTITPGATVGINAYWCGYIACSTSGYDKNQGCMEKTSSTDSKLTPGGYAAWFSISPGSLLCSIPAAAANMGTSPYSCSIAKNDEGVLELTWQYLSLTQYYSAGSNMGSKVTLPTPTQYKTAPYYRGVNISGLEYDGTYLDGIYQLPDLPDAQYFVEEGMNTIRIPIRAEFWYADNSGVGTNLASSHLNNTALPSYPNTIYRAAVVDIVNKYLANGLNVILDLHNYMRWCPTGETEGQGNEPTDPVTNGCSVLTSTQLADIWTSIAGELKDSANLYPDSLIFGLQNEPFSQSTQQVSTETVFNNEVAAIKAIRAVGIPSNLIIMSGNYWDPLHGWVDYVPADGSAVDNDIPNGKMFTSANLQKNGIDKDNNIAIEMHQYFDSDYSGRNSTCNAYENYNDFVTKLDLNNFGSWMNANHMRVLLTEFGAADNATCQQDLTYMMQYINEHAEGASAQNNGGFIGWTLWRGNRHAVLTGYGAFSYLNQANYNVYGGNGTSSSTAGTGINPGAANGLIESVFVSGNQLTPASY